MNAKWIFSWRNSAKQWIFNGSCKRKKQRRFVCYAIRIKRIQIICLMSMHVKIGNQNVPYIFKEIRYRPLIKWCFDLISYSNCATEFRIFTWSSKVTKYISLKCMSQMNNRVTFIGRLKFKFGAWEIFLDSIKDFIFPSLF